jgi:nitrogen-specific signal transduction histidine kinase
MYPEHDDHTLEDDMTLDQLRNHIKTVAHRIKSPLSTLKLNLYLLQHQDNPAEADRYVEVIEEQMALLAEMVDQLAALGIPAQDDAGDEHSQLTH